MLRIKILSLLRTAAAIGFLTLGIPACTTQEPEFIRPVAETVTLSTAQLEQWYTRQAGSLKAADPTELTTAGSTTSDMSSLDWTLTSTTHIGTATITLVPFTDAPNRFAGSGYHGHRYLLIVQKTTQQPKAAIIEVLATTQHSMAESRALFLALYQKGRTATPLSVQAFTGFVFYYDLRYQFRAGRRYIQSRVVPGNPQLSYSADDSTPTENAQRGTNTCVYLITSHAPPYTVNVCPPSSGGGGQYGGSSTGGGTGGSSTPSDYPQLPGGDDSGVLEDGSNGTTLFLVDISALPPCLKGVAINVQQIENGRVGLINNYFSNYGRNWVLVDGRLSASTIGQTHSIYSHNQVITTFDSYQMRNSTDLYMAAILMHESVHAYLVAYFSQNRTHALSTYPQLVSDWTNQVIANPGSIPSLNGLHHDEIVRTFINDLAASLQEYGQSRGHTLPQQFYRDLAWSGLTDTSAFTSKPANEQTRIKNVIGREFDGFNQDGTPEPPSGSRPPGC
jgi:hypothetical protein